MFCASCVSWVLLCERVCFNCSWREQQSSRRNVQRERISFMGPEKIMKGQSCRARHNEGWESSEEQVEKQTTTIFVLAGSHIKYE